MSQILFEFFALSLLTERMKNLKLRCEAGKKTPPAAQGGGETEAQLEEMVRRYDALNDALSLMIDNTVAALENAKTTMANTDKTIASAIRWAEDLQESLS